MNIISCLGKCNLELGRKNIITAVNGLLFIRFYVYTVYNGFSGKRNIFLIHRELGGAGESISPSPER